MDGSVALAQRVQKHSGGIPASQESQFRSGCRIAGRGRKLLAGGEYEVDSTSVLELVRDSDCSAYDCEFVALAEKLDVKLVTMDKKLLRAFPSRTVALDSI